MNTFATASGVAGWGVSMRTRSSAKSPFSRSTGAPLMPLPPKSMPKGSPVPRCVLMAPSHPPPARAATWAASRGQPGIRIDVRRHRGSAPCRPARRRTVSPADERGSPTEIAGRCDGSRDRHRLLYARRGSSCTELGSGMALLDGTVVNVALRTIGTTSAPLAQLQWIVNAYLLALASLILLGGALGDRSAGGGCSSIGVVWFAVASAALRARAQPRDPDRRPGAPGRRRRAAHSGQPGDHRGGRSARGPRPRDRRLDRPRRHRRRDRSVARRRARGVRDWRWIFLVNVPLAGSPSRSRCATSRRPATPSAGRFDVLGAALGAVGARRPDLLR